jgi:hypothetical protein
MYTPSRIAIYGTKSFAVPQSGVAHTVTVDVTQYGYPPDAVAVELLLGCRSWTDGAYAAAYDGTTASVDRIAAYPTALMRNQWGFARCRVELEGSRFLLRIRPEDEMIEVIAVLKGYYS